jgi:hypothetical protein
MMVTLPSLPPPQEIEHDSERRQWLVRYAWALVALPLLALPFTPLMGNIQSLKADGNQSLGTTAVLGLLLGKCIYLYTLALTRLDLIAWRSVNAPLGLGSRFKRINAELFDGLELAKTETQVGPQSAHGILRVKEVNTTTGKT